MNYETVALFRTSEQQKRAGLRDCCTFSYFRTAKASGITRLLHFFVLPNSKSERDYETVALFRTSEQQKRAGLRDCCTFSYFRTAKASGITRLLHFFVLPNSKSERDYETVALFRTSEQQKRAGLRDCCTFSYFRTAKASGITRLLHFFVLPNSKSERDYETVALFRTSEQQKRAGLRDCCTFSYFRTAKASGITRLLHFFVLPNSKSERDYETVALFRTSEQQKRAGLRDCCTFSYFRTAKASGITRLLLFFVSPKTTVKLC